VRRARGIASAAAALAMAVSGITHAAEPEARAANPGVQVERSASFEVVRATLPGRLIAFALAGSKDGRRDVILLAQRGVPQPAAKSDPCPPTAAPVPAAAASPLLLMRLDSTGAGSLDTLRDDLPSDAFGLDSIDLEGDGAEELLLSRPGRVDVLRDDASRRWLAGPTLLMADPGLAPQEPARPGPRALRGDGAASVFDVSLLGAARFYGPSADHLSWDLLHEAALPMEAARDEAGLKLTGGRVVYVGRDAGGAPVFASGPQSFGRTRLKTFLIAPAPAGAAGGPGTARNAECWSRLAGPESVMEAAYVILDGRPALFVATRPADKLSIFGEKLLRLFLLDEADRSHTGTAPILETESHMNLWQRATPEIVDVDHDGRQDLVVGYWKGLKDSRVMLDVYLRQADQSFSRSPVSTGFDVIHGDRSMVAYGRDLDGDGTLDLMVRSADSLLIFPGNPASRGGRDLVLPVARWSITLPASENGDTDDVDFDLQFGSDGQESKLSLSMDESSGPRPVDLDQDGVPEILSFVSGEGGTGQFQVIRLRRVH